MTFAQCAREELLSRRQAHGATRGEGLAPLEYQDEIKLKEIALRRFWDEHELHGRIEALEPSPRSRGYRTTSKRRVALVHGIAHLFLGDRRAHRETPRFTPSALEPGEHTAVYRFLQARLSDAALHLVARHLHWLIVRGSYAERAVIFNVDEISGPIVRKLKALAAELATLTPPVVASFLYVDPTGSDYYLEARRPSDSLGFKNLGGPDTLRVSYGALRFAFHPTSFCQVNESIVPRMIALVGEMLAPAPADRLLDLYCGFGLFSIALADRVREVIGIDIEGPSIESARRNAERLRRGRTRFESARITAASLARLPRASGDEVILLDPPRNGTEEDVIATLAARRPRRVLHIFCNVDEIPRALAEWRAGGYRPRRIVPLDMFPGTVNLEVLISLESTVDNPGRGARMRERTSPPSAARLRQGSGSL